MKQTLTTVVCALALSGSAVQASTILTVADPHYVGVIIPGIPPDDPLIYVNALILLDPNQVVADCVDNDDCDRTGSTIPKHTLSPGTAFIKTDIVGGLGTQNLGIDITGYSYITGKYDAEKGGTFVWYVGNLTGKVDLPGKLGSCGKSGCGLSNYSLITASVPDGGATLGLLGLAMLGVGYLRRRVA